MMMDFPTELLLPQKTIFRSGAIAALAAEHEAVRVFAESIAVATRGIAR